MTTEESMQDEHLAIAFEANRQLRLENKALRDALEFCRDKFYITRGTRMPIIENVLAKYAQAIPCTTAEQSKP